MPSLRPTPNLETSFIAIVVTISVGTIIIVTLMQPQVETLPFFISLGPSSILPSALLRSEVRTTRSNSNRCGTVPILHGHETLYRQI